LQIDFIFCYFAEAVYDVQEVFFFWCFFRYKIISSENRDSLTSSFPVCIPFISSSYFIGLAENSKTMFNKSGESGHLVLFLTLEEMVSVFPHLD
jgi:hypothetical protein